MLVFVATALGATLIGWPCNRLNWGWRNVWSTCSINSYAPITGGGSESLATQATGFRFNEVITAPNTVPSRFPTQMLSATGVFTFRAPSGPLGGAPQMLCAWAPNTGAGATAGLRNRCKRAIDAYGGLVTSCQQPAGTAIRGPIQLPVGNSLFTDFAPAATHVPHVQNVQGLAQNAQLCQLPTAGAAGYTLADLTNFKNPGTVCPGLLGWFTVVFNACGFTNAPGLSTTPQTNPTWPAVAPLGAGNPYINTYFPVGTPIAGLNPSVVTEKVLGPAGVAATSPMFTIGTDTPSGQGASFTTVGVFCSPRSVYGGGTLPLTALGSPIRGPGGATPMSWNDVGISFRTSRCRKALDQFGRTASRCEFGGASNTPNPLGSPSQAGGYSDPLRLLAIGAPFAPAGNTAQNNQQKLGMNSWAPLCN